MMRTTSRNHAFTLVELLIVMAVIAILSAIAVPNLLEAQTRSKVSRVKADFRALATAIEAYHTDYKHYPPWMDGGNNEINPVRRRLVPLTTPVAYISSVPYKDPFPDERDPKIYNTYDYVDAESFARDGDPEPSFRSRGAEWRINSAGPDRFNSFGGPSYMNPPENPGYDYDPTNGTVSKGDIVRVGPKSHYRGNHLYPDRVE